MADRRESAVDEVLDQLLHRHEDLITGEALESIGIKPGALIDAATFLLHSAKTEEPMIHKLCGQGLTVLLKLAMCIGVEAGIKSCAGFKRPN